MDLHDKKEKILSFLQLLISHHQESYYDRTLSLKIRGKKIHLCARCTGIMSSLLISSIIMGFLRFFLHVSLDPYLSLILAVFFLIPTLIDWSTQKLEFRESTNSIRIGLGIFLGIGMMLLQFTVTISVYTSIAIVLALVFFFSVVTIQNYRINRQYNKLDA